MKMTAGRYSQVNKGQEKKYQVSTTFHFLLLREHTQLILFDFNKVNIANCLQNILKVQTWKGVYNCKLSKGFSLSHMVVVMAMHVMHVIITITTIIIFWLIGHSSHLFLFQVWPWVEIQTRAAWIAIQGAADADADADGKVDHDHDHDQLIMLTKL